MKFAIFFLLCCALNSTFVKAATYNFYFNNTEQGANSQANPNLSVNSDKADGSTASAQAAPEEIPSAAALKSSEESASTQTVLTTIPVELNTKLPVGIRMGLGLTLLDTDEGLTRPDRWILGHKQTRLLFNNTFTFGEHLGASILLGALNGVEALFRPIGASLSQRLGWTLDLTFGYAALFSTSGVPYWRTRGGVGIAFPLKNQWELTAQVRTNPFESGRRDRTQGSLGFQKTF